MRKSSELRIGLSIRASTPPASNQKKIPSKRGRIGRQGGEGGGDR